MKRFLPIIACAILMPVGAFADCPGSYYETLTEYNKKNDIVINVRKGCKVIRTKALDNCVAKKSISWMDYENDELVSYGHHDILFDGTTVQTERIMKVRGPLGFRYTENFARVSIDGVPLCEKASRDGFSATVLDCEMMAEKFIEDKCRKVF